MGKLLARFVCLSIASMLPALLPAAQGAHSASGAVNYVEGQVSLDGAPLGREIAMTTVVGNGRAIQTEQGRAEVLLTPGVFVRLAEKSALRLVNATDMATRVELLRGQAALEVVELGSKQKLEVVDKQAYARLLSPGVYLFNADNPAILVYSGKARVEDDKRGATVGKGQKLIPAPEGAMKTEKFDLQEIPPLYAWTEQRALAAVSTSWSTVEGLVASDPNAKYDAGWYWNPWFNAWGYVPQDGFRKSPFGFGFYAVGTSQYIPPLFESFRQ